ncbi:MAG: iron ABC transporter permease [Methanomassiliicoccaceae archaeon]|jgi:iron complex transport system permease protein|nr:iron ABC transporter permease [Methanomassiliicoccaceae archaeon]
MTDVVLLLLVAAVVAVVLLSVLYVRKSDGADISLTSKRKRRLAAIVASGISITLVMFIVALSLGSAGTIPVTDAISSMFSAIQNGVHTGDERTIFHFRMPRAIVSITVGIGLAVAGCIYQAIIRNPLVDSYITGVSSGAGFAAILAIVSGTAFGFALGSSLVVPIAAIIGGLLALTMTMLIGEKAGGSSTNYVLAGVVVGFMFAAMQTLVLAFSGDKLRNAVFWLYGSFANLDWSMVGLVVIPVLAMSFLTLLWAKELNLVLLGEDQARQAGLNVKKFNRSMMIFASIITAICVAFVGIIGFVGLVVPHICRMILGGDHRLVLPASIAIGGFMMLVADMIARMAITQSELPVGAITALIGVPLFAFLLMKKGRMYDG